ncbi:MAG TPA: hypothetical protein DEP05_03090, partial [Betaproteobacteria bacterium]|nr:hypothetical protein [Betaproteobacteria bacterium]
MTARRRRHPPECCRMKTIVPPVLTGLVLFVAGVFGAAHAFPALFAMTSAEAWCFLLAGVGLMVSRFHRLRRLRAVMGAAVVSAALAAVFYPDAPLLGGMGALSAIGFVLSGAMLALLDRVAQRAASLLAQGGLAAILTIGLVGLCAHMPDLALIYGVSPRAVAMSVPAAAGMVVLAVGLWLACAASDWFWAFYQWREDRQILVLSAMLLLGLTLAAGLGGVMVVSRHSVPLLEKSFQNVLYTDTLLFQNQIEAAVHETASIVSHPALGRFLAKGAAVEGAGAFYEQFVRITETWGMVSVTRFQVMDAAGREVVASGRTEPLAGFRVPLRTPYPAALFWRDGWRVRLRAPVFYDGRRVGRVVIEIRLNKLNAVFDHAKQWGASADFNVCAKQRVGLACFLSPGLTEGRRDAFGEGYAAPMRRALAGRQGVMTESGFQGAPVIAAYTPIGDSGLGMVLKIDARDLYQPLRQQLSRALVVFLLLIALGAGFLFLRVRPLVRHLAAAKRYMRAVLDNVPDAIITTD